MRNVLAAVLGVLAGACAPQHRVVVDANGPVPRVVEGERLMVGAAERIHLVVRDTVWGNRWVVKHESAELPPIERSSVFGNTGSIAALATWFKPSAVLSLADAPLVDRDSATEIGVEYRPTGSRAGFRSDVARIESLVGQARDEHVTAWAEATAYNDEISKLARYESLLPFAFDTGAHRLARELAKDTAADEAPRLVRLMLFGGPRLEPGRLDSVVSRATQYADRVRAFSEMLPAVPAGHQDLVGIITESRERRNRALAAIRRRDLLLRSARELADDPGVSIVDRTEDPVFDAEIAGRDVRPLLEPGAAEALGEAGKNLASLPGTMKRLATALNRLPYWTRNPEDEVVGDEMFTGGSRITFTFVQRPRYPTFDFGDGAGSPGAGSEAASDTAPPPGASSGLRSVTARADVLPRHRIHVGAGLVASPLDLNTYSTAADTVDGVAGLRLREENRASWQTFPALLLSYTLVPFEGKSYDARDYATSPWWRSTGLALQAGVSLREPSENVFLGVGTELIPGLHFAWGYHFGYVERTAFRAGDFVPEATGAPVSKAWAGRWHAGSLGVDVKTFFETVGSLFK